MKLSRMVKGRAVVCCVACFFASLLPTGAQTHRPASGPYLGFDKNGYPGDHVIRELHNTFAFTGYWLNNPPGMSSNPWAGKRELVQRAGLGFAVLFNGRLYAELKGKDSGQIGRDDGADAVSAAKREGFPPRTVIFLDQEEGGHLLPEQSAYLFAWVDAVRRSSYRPGVYASGIPVPNGRDEVSTAGEIAAHDADVALWIANDQCPPAPGCVIPQPLPAPEASGFRGASIWQYSQSPRRPQFTAKCTATYAADGNCYAQGIPQNSAAFLDLDSANSPDPSQGR